MDDYTWSHPDLRGKETFDLVMSRLGIEAESKQIDVADVSIENIGSWQITLFLGVFYHLIDPIAALRRLAAITEEVLILETHLELRDLSTPAMAFFPNRELGGDPTNWWAPNAPAVEALLKVFGFERVLTTSNPVSPGIRGIFHAFKTEAIYDEQINRIAKPSDGRFYRWAGSKSPSWSRCSTTQSKGCAARPRCGATPAGATRRKSASSATCRATSPTFHPPCAPARARTRAAGREVCGNLDVDHGELR